MSSSSALASLSPYVIIQSQLLGALTVTEEEIFSFPTGLFGFPECRSFVMVGTDRTGFYWLQSVDHATLAFILVDPFLYFDGYAVDVAPADLVELGVEGGSDLAIFAIVTLPRSHDEPPTANLQGPLALNMRLSRGKQLAVQDPRYGVRCELDLGAVASAE
jgi:flagellar assembly factor FliW